MHFPLEDGSGKTAEGGGGGLKCQTDHPEYF